MLRRLLPLVAGLFGAGVLALMIRETGLEPLRIVLTTNGWILLGLVLIWGVTYLANARAWQLLVPDRPATFTLPRAFVLTVTSFGINFLTPLMAVGGEPIKVAGAMRSLTRDQAAGSVISFRLLHSLAHALVFILAAVPALILLPRTPVVVGTTILAATVMSGIVLLLISGHQEGFFVRSVHGLGRWRPTRGLAARLWRHRRLFHNLDREMTAIRRESPRQFRLALAVELLGRLFSTLEFPLMLYAVGLPIDLWQGFVIANVSSLITVIFFFVPFEMGTKEGGIFLVMSLLGHDPVVATTTALLSRVREIAWGGISLICLSLLDLRRPLRPASEPP